MRRQQCCLSGPTEKQYYDAAVQNHVVSKPVQSLKLVSSIVVVEACIEDALLNVHMSSLSVSELICFSFPQ